MNGDEIRIAIAQNVGFTEISFHGDGRNKTLIGEDEHGIDRDIPDYCRDLNAMHEAEQVLIKEQLQKYRNILGNICAKTMPSVTFSEKGRARLAICAPAKFRAEAFLRTINKWKD